MTEVSSRHSIGETLLSVERINLAFGEVKALANVSFNVREHEVLAIIGPNGAGKTSMLNVINGFYHPQQGQIHFKGLHRQRMKPHEAAVQGIAGIGIGLDEGQGDSGAIITQGRQGHAQGLCVRGIIDPVMNIVAHLMLVPE